MQKKLIAIAVAGALGAPALAMAQSTVQIYGRATVEYSYIDRGSGTEKGDVLQTPGGSAIGFKGEEKLGGGLSVWFQCESSLDVTEGGAGFCSRNSALGFKGGFGSVFIGRWDTPFKQAAFVGDRVGSEDTGVQGNSRLMYGNSTGTIGVNNRGVWKRRQANTINYNTPNFGGFTGRVSYSSLEASGLAAGANEPRLWSIAGLYAQGPLSVAVAYEKHRDFGSPGTSATVGIVGGVPAVIPATAAVPGLDDDAWLIGARYRFGKLLVGASFTQQNFDGAAGSSADIENWTVGAEYHLSGPHYIGGSFTRAGDFEGTPGFAPTSLRPAAGTDNGAKQWQIAYRHVLSKRTEARLAYVVVDNDSGTNNYTLNGLSSSPVPPAGALGEKQQGISLHLKHNF